MERPQRLVFGTNAEEYDAARPSYPDELFAELVSLVGPGARTLDVGCGTGKATVQLAGAGFTGVGLEPDADMAAVARRNVAPHPGWRIERSDFEAFETTETFGLLTCAQAWHWLDAEVRLSRAGALVEPGGVLALFWNRPAPTDDPLHAAIDAVYDDPRFGHVPPRLGVRGALPVEDSMDEAGFDHPVARTLPWSQTYSTAEWLALCRTQSNHMMLDPGEQSELLTRVGAVIDEHGGRYEHRYVTKVWTARRRRSSP